MNQGCQKPGAVMVLWTLWQSDVSRCHPCLWWVKFSTSWCWLFHDRNKYSLSGQFIISASPEEQALWLTLASPWQPPRGRLKSRETRKMSSSFALNAVSQVGRADWVCLQGGYESLICVYMCVCVCVCVCASLLLYSIIKSGELE